MTGSDFVIEDKEYITDKQGHLYYGTMSGTPNNPTGARREVRAHNAEAIATMPVWPILPSPPPQQADVDRALGSATAAWLVANDRRRVRVARSSSTRFARCFASAGMRLRTARAQISEEDTLGPVTVELERHGRPIAALRVGADLSIQLAWDTAAQVDAPAALRAWLTAHGRAVPRPEPGRGEAPAGLASGGALVPPGTTLVAATSSSYRRLCTDGSRVFAIDGWRLVRLKKEHGVLEVCPVFRPDTPIAIRNRAVLLLDPSGRRCIVTEEGESRPDLRPLCGLPTLRLRHALPRFTEARDAALARLVPNDADLLPLDPGYDACDAYEAFGGPLPAAPAAALVLGLRRSARAPARGAEARRSPERRARRPPCLAGRDRTGCARRRGAR